MPRVWRDDGVPVDLSERDFVAQGGEGRVYAQGGLAYKLALDPARALGPARLHALAPLAHPRILKPEGLVRDDRGAPLGFFAPFLPDAWPLVRLLSAPFRARHGLGPDALLSLLAALVELVDHAHDRGLQVVDLHPENILVTPAPLAPWLIDVDSWQAPGFPATAVLDSVRDRHAPDGHFSAATDWFAFAVVAFHLLVGVHPYRGGHPVAGLDARMRQNISALRPEVVLPPCATPPALLPAPLRAWFHDVLEAGARTPPPRLALVAPLGPAPTLPPAPAEPFSAHLADGLLHLTDRATGAPVGLTLAARAFAWHAGRLHALTADALVEITVRALGGRLFATPRVLAPVLPHATRLFDGVALLDALGAAHALLLPAPGVCATVRLPPLDGRRVAEASLRGDTLTVHLGRPDGRFDRLAFRFDGSWRAPELAPSAVVDAPDARA